jgi:hypothetical protein
MSVEQALGWLVSGALGAAGTAVYHHFRNPCSVHCPYLRDQQLLTARVTGLHGNAQKGTEIMTRLEDGLESLERRVSLLEQRKPPGR